MDSLSDWFFDCPAAVTVTDKEGTILAMNKRSRELFADDGGEALIGTKVLDCHPEPVKRAVEHLYDGGRSNHYIIAKDEGNTIVHQFPFFKAGEFAGIVELSMAIPADLPTVKRD